MSEYETMQELYRRANDNDPTLTAEEYRGLYLREVDTRKELSSRLWRVKSYASNLRSCRGFELPNGYSIATVLMRIFRGAPRVTYADLLDPVKMKALKKEMVQNEPA